MRDGNEGDDERVTELGVWLRERHYDEIPQLINVWRREMDGIGPRPLMIQPEEFDRRFREAGDLDIIPIHNDRYKIRPGLSCIFQTTKK